MIANIITPILVGLAALSGTVLADTKNIHGGFVSMCAPETIKLCSSQADLAADKISLCASCYNDNTKSVNLNTASKLDLNHCLTNFNGQLSWRNNGSFARAGCSKCTTHLASSFELNLQCECDGPDNTIVQPIENPTINLNEGIHLHNGQLVCFEEEGTQVFASTVKRRRKGTDYQAYKNPAFNPGPRNRNHTFKRDASPDYTNPLKDNPAFHPGPHNHTWKRDADASPDYTNPEKTNPAFHPGPHNHTWKRDASPDYTNPLKDNPAFHPGPHNHTWKRDADASPDYTNPEKTNPAFHPGPHNHTF